MNGYLTAIIVAILAIYAYIIKRQLDAAKHTKLDKRLKNLTKGLKAKRKKVKNAKKNYHDLRDKYGRFAKSRRKRRNS